MDWSSSTGVKLAVAAAGTVSIVWYLRRGTRQREDWPAGSGRARCEVYQKEAKAATRKRHMCKNFPPPYPNGWAFVCPSSKLGKRGVLPLHVCGKHLVLFRGDDNKAGVLDAFCPHMSTHLGYGGFVQGNSIVCPYHEWQFGTDGKLVKMPFGGRATAECGATSCNTTSYPVIERFGMIFAWFHADGGEPYELDLLDLLAKKRLRFLGRIVDDDFMMHCMEPSHNSADWYHFKTVHSRLGQHWLSGGSILHADHELLPARMALDGGIDDDGQPITKKQLLIVDEKLKSLHLFGTIPLPGAGSFASAQVRFNGPMVSAFCIKMFGIAEIMLFMNLTPVEPFRTHAEYMLYADWWVPKPLGHLLAYLVIRTANQDREVWEHRGHPEPRNPVKGDYDYTRYDSWLQQFYSKSSTTWETAYEDLTF